VRFALGKPMALKQLVQGTYGYQKTYLYGTDEAQCNVVTRGVCQVAGATQFSVCWPLSPSHP